MGDLDYALEHLEELEQLIKEKKKADDKFLSDEQGLSALILERIGHQVTDILTEIAQESGNWEPQEISCDIQRGMLYGRIAYDHSEGYLRNNKINGKFIITWADNEFKSRVHKLGIPKKYIGYCNIDAPFRQ